MHGYTFPVDSNGIKLEKTRWMTTKEKENEPSKIQNNIDEYYFLD